MAYFVGTLGNLVPLPGGVGGVEAGMIGALIGFGVSGGLAIVAVLAYRAFAFWLPVLPGASCTCSSSGRCTDGSTSSGSFPGRMAGVGRCES
jgi:uncharacterized membrane protein YbhN (UPF0104 family)